MSYLADPRVDAYIGALPDWQQDICRELRDLIHAADPEVTETIKRSPAAVLRAVRQRLRAAGGEGSREPVPVRRRYRPRPGGHHHGRPRQRDRAHDGRRQGETINAPALTVMLRQIIANNRAGGWRKIKARSERPGG